MDHKQAAKFLRQAANRLDPAKPAEQEKAAVIFRDFANPEHRKEIMKEVIENMKAAVKDLQQIDPEHAKSVQTALDELVAEEGGERSKVAVNEPGEGHSVSLGNGLAQFL
jgi:uncharacterized heparinase superfamily protein